jgi:hypothetical protein
MFGQNRCDSLLIFLPGVDATEEGVELLKDTEVMQEFA